MAVTAPRLQQDLVLVVQTFSVPGRSLIDNCDVVLQHPVVLGRPSSIRSQVTPASLRFLVDRIAKLYPKLRPGTAQTRWCSLMGSVFLQIIQRTRCSGSRSRAIEGDAQTWFECLEGQAARQQRDIEVVHSENDQCETTSAAARPLTRGFAKP
jgi:hypothetical protein